MANRLMTKNSRPSILSRLSLTNIIIVLNVLAFILFYIVLQFSPQISNYLALTPSLVINNYYFWTILTSIFMHAGLFHLFVNMFSLFFLGNQLVEKIIGRKRFLWLYLISGIVAGIFFIAFSYLSPMVYRGDLLFGTPTTSGVGASGAIFGLLGVLSMLIPNKKVYLIIGPLILIILQFTLLQYLSPGIQQVLSFIIPILLFIMIFGIFSSNKIVRALALPIRMPFWISPIAAIIPLVVISFFVSLPFANTAHLGGLIVGLIYGAYLRKKYPKKVNILNQMIR